MVRQALSDDPKARARRRRRAADTARWRSRQRRRVRLFEIEAGEEQFGGLRENTAGKRAVGVALGRVFRRTLVALQTKKV